jgi:hypothetical protein
MKYSRGVVGQKPVPASRDAFSVSLSAKSVGQR